MVSSTPRPHFTPGKDPVRNLQGVEWASGLVWTGGKSCPHQDSIPDSPARSSVTIPNDLPSLSFIKFIIQEQLNTDMEYCELNSPLVKLDKSFRCKVCPCYERKKIASSISYKLFIQIQRTAILKGFAFYYGQIQFEC